MSYFMMSDSLHRYSVRGGKLARSIDREIMMLVKYNGPLSIDLPGTREGEILVVHFAEMNCRIFGIFRQDIPVIECPLHYGLIRVFIQPRINRKTPEISFHRGIAVYSNTRKDHQGRKKDPHSRNVIQSIPPKGPQADYKYGRILLFFNMYCL